MQSSSVSVSFSRAATIEPIRVFIAEDHRITQWGLQRLVDDARPQMQVIGTASSRLELVGHPALEDADVLLLDIDLGGDNVIDVLSDLQRRCRGRFLVLTGADDVKEYRRAILKGARGVLHKSQPAETILRAIHKVHAGELWVERGLLGDVLGELTGVAPKPQQDDVHARRIASLTPREREIIRVMPQHPGAKHFAIAEILAMSEHTLRNHLTTIYAKLGVRGRLELHLYALEHGLAAATSAARRAS